MLEYFNNDPWSLIGIVGIYLICIPMVVWKFIGLLAMSDSPYNVENGDRVMIFVCILSAPLALLCFLLVEFTFKFPKSKYGKKIIAWNIERKLKRTKFIGPLQWAVNKRQQSRKEKQNESTQ